MKTLVYNGKIYLEKGSFAQAIIIEDGIVTSVGTNEEMLAIAGDSEKIDANSNAVIPGFNDSHIHLYSVGTALESVQLYGLTSKADCIKAAREFIEKNNVPAGTFVTGRGWNQDYFTDDETPLSKVDLDMISTEHPILFNRACGHMATCNTKALEVCGITKKTPQVDGAEFYYGEDGEPNGIFTEEAIKLISNHVPEPTPEEMAQTILTAYEYAVSQGITSIQTNDINEVCYADMVKAYDLAYKSGKIIPRAYHQCYFSQLETYQEFLDAGYKTGFGNAFNKIGPLKMFVDGSLGARTAYMRTPYADDSTTSGISCMSQEHINNMVKLADINGCQVAIHAIGDKAIEMVLNGYDTVVGDENTNRHAVIHCQITDKAMVQRFKDKDILAQVQPIFIHYDMHIVGSRVGAEMESTSYAFGDMYKMGIKVGYGTDSPVEDLKTMDNVYCAVVRKDLKAFPENGYFPEQRVSVEEAIEMYTSGSAYCSFEENVKGKLLPDYYADLVILDRDIFEMDVENLRDVKVTMTMVDGKIAYKA